jgi:cytochrome P450
MDSLLSLTPLSPSLLKVPPGPSVPIAPDAFQDPLHFLLDLTRAYGDMVRYPTAYGPVYLVNHPDYVGYVLQSNNFIKTALLKIIFGESLFTSEGAYWRRQRRIMQPAFHQERIAALDKLITGATLGMLRRWQALADSGQPLNVAAETAGLTLRIIGKALFSIDFSDKENSLHNAITSMLEKLGHSVCALFPLPNHVAPSRNRSLQTALQTVDRSIYRMIKERRCQSEKGTDLLSMLLAWESETGEELAESQLRDEVFTMFLAGHETTANMLAWALYLLSEYPEVEDHLNAELSRVLGQRLPAFQDLPNLPYSRMILQETLRLYPPGWFLVRKAVREDNVGGYRIPADTPVIVSPYAMHRHPAYWEKPEQFDPERFAPERSENRPVYAYLPFGGGKHLCIGNHLAMLEGQLVLATIAQRFRLRMEPGQSVEPNPLLTLRPKHGLMMRLSTKLAMPMGT